VALKSSSANPSIDPERSIPALLTSTSIAPVWTRIAVVAASTDSSESTSIFRMETGRCSFSTTARSAAPRSRFRIVANTL